MKFIFFTWDDITVIQDEINNFIQETILSYPWFVIDSASTIMTEAGLYTITIIYKI